MSRPIYQIAQDIKRTWVKPSPYALPYLNALLELTDITDLYYFDSARSVILYFLSNAQTFKGEDAKRLKAELRGCLK